MEITIRGEKRFIPVSTITVQTTDETNPFHCPNCGNMISIIGGKVTKMYPILEPTTQLVVSFQCHSCRSRFTFQEESVKDIKNSSIKVLLNPTQNTEDFYCYIGGKKHGNILGYTKNKYYSFPLHKDVQLPFVSSCSDSLCPLTYKFTQLS